nr:hypothetical protein [uncultured Cetobacterium sp.]
MKKIIFFIITLTLIGCSNLSKKQYTNEEVAAAVSVDNVYIVNRAIKNGFNIDTQFQSGETLLSIALKENSVQVLMSLLTNGVDVNTNLPPFKVIGTDVILPPRAPIFYVSSLDALNLLIKNRANLNEVDGSGELLLNYFIKNRPSSYAIELIKEGADLNIKDSSEWYPIFWAVNVENEEMLRELILKDNNQYLLKDKKGNYPVYYANSRDVMRYLLSFNYNLNERNIYGENILGEVYLKAKSLGYKDIQDILMKKGVNPNYTSYR